MLTEKDYCDYETCAALEGVGFPLHPYGNTEIDTSLRLTLLLYEAQKWLREEKKIHISVNYLYIENDVFEYVLRCIGKRGSLSNAMEYDSYEEALLEGIMEAITLLKEEK